MKGRKVWLEQLGELSSSLQLGELLLLHGRLFLMRDAAHKRLFPGDTKPDVTLDWNGKTIFYAGPAKPLPGWASGSIGPTTSLRMDPFLPALLQAGACATMGKGLRGEQARQACQRWNAVYLVAPSGCAAVLAQRIRKMQVVAFEELGPEAIFQAEVEDFPALVAIDSQGHSLFNGIAAPQCGS
ncbi:MAG TPA: FumA C-terminus/TtdB family hydratase beta subunit [Thermotogota bacterium]|nr:FumA C-terminus/TtdB family hydratase beta subunit [Thermotogota bacterium]